MLNVFNICSFLLFQELHINCFPAFPWIWKFPSNRILGRTILKLKESFRVASLLRLKTKLLQFIDGSSIQIEGSQIVMLSELELLVCAPICERKIHSLKWWVMPLSEKVLYTNHTLVNFAQKITILLFCCSSITSNNLPPVFWWVVVDSWTHYSLF